MIKIIAFFFSLLALSLFLSPLVNEAKHFTFPLLLITFAIVIAYLISGEQKDYITMDFAPGEEAIIYFCLTIFVILTMTYLCSLPFFQRFSYRSMREECPPESILAALSISCAFVYLIGKVGINDRRYRPTRGNGPERPGNGYYTISSQDKVYGDKINFLTY